MTYKAFHPDPNFIYPYPLGRTHESVTEELTNKQVIATLLGKDGKTKFMLRSWGYITCACQPDKAELLMDLLGLMATIPFETRGMTPRVTLDLSIKKMQGLFDIPTVCPVMGNDQLFELDFRLFSSYLTHLRTHLSVSYQLGDKGRARTELEAYALEHKGYKVQLTRKVKKFSKGTLCLLVPDHTKESLYIGAKYNVGSVYLPNGLHERAELGSMLYLDFQQEQLEANLGSLTKVNDLLDRAKELPVELAALFYKKALDLGKLTPLDWKSKVVAASSYTLKHCGSVVIACPLTKETMFVDLAFSTTKGWRGEEFTQWAVTSKIPMAIGQEYRPDSILGFLLPEAIKQLKPTTRFVTRIENQLPISSYDLYAAIHALKQKLLLSEESVILGCMQPAA